MGKRSWPMTNDEFPMTKEIPMTNDQFQREGSYQTSTPTEKVVGKRAQPRTVWHRLHLSFRLCHSLGIWNSSFVIPAFARVAQLAARSYRLQAAENPGAWTFSGRI
jgi:hypothetical protein